ncbi:alpha/beta-hydrolase family protein [Williamsia soli]|uniref:alpha/beta-hydrolase family protein n=1 Tax=Williamsia soli TaxID=364929 RepID=UPI001A9FB2B1|nr:alpha/beta-hydrolase family protein [Williamsia soli]
MSAPRWPHSLVSTGALMGAAVALAPGSLPRTGLIAGLLLAAFGGLGALLGAIAGHWRPCGNRSRRIAAAVAGTLGLAFFTAMVLWQNDLRGALGTRPVDAVWIVTALAPSVVVAAACALGRRSRAVVAVVAAALALTAMPSPAGANPAEAVATTFVSADAQPSSLRIYGSLEGSDKDFDNRAAATVHRWQIAGGMERGAVVVAVPTGSGWVDGDALRGFESRFGGDVSVIALQYSDIPSWQAFLGSPEPARASAVALVSALVRTVGAAPESSRPSIYVYGQSLGAVGADAARSWAERRAPDSICHTVLVGAPADSAALAAARTTVVANGSDPVVRWSPRLLWQPPVLPPATSSDLPTPPWFPVAGFVQASVDLIGALSYPAGHGHQYGTEQGLTVPSCPR